jgi:hypothetical protein
VRGHAKKPADRRLLQEVVRLLQSEARYRSVVGRILAAERRYATQAVGASERRLMRLQTAKALFYAAIDKGAAFRTVERRFREVTGLSRRDLHSYVLVHINFAGHCEDAGKRGAGIRRLERLEAELDRFEDTASRKLLARCRADVAHVLRRLRNKQETGTGPARERSR